MRMYRTLLTVIGVAAAGFAAPPLSAQSVNDRPVQARIYPKGVTKVVKTPLPNWQVGTIDKSLSKLCSLGQFNQRVPFRYAGSFTGNSGASLLGAAKGSGLNLFDPQKKAKSDRDYWFYRDRTSNCIVYWAQVKAQT